EPIWAGTKLAGFVTSGGFGHWVGKSLAMAYVESPYAVSGAELDVHVLGVLRKAKLLDEPAVDPSGSRMRA
ncbi:MAG: glycine cleavage T C-terminal barrel domain-containing protein, partial [Terriglobales bacterium]